MDYTRFDQTDLFDKLNELDAWLANEGLGQRNRLRVYRDNLILLRDRENMVGAAALFAAMQDAGRLGEILASYVEGSEIVDALMVLRTAHVDIPIELLKRALDGAPDASSETSKNNQGRNAMFELSICAMLARQNLRPKFGTGNPDVEFQFEGRRVLVECKRVLSEERTLDVISRGIRQLRKQVPLSRGDVGLVAVNISRVFYKGDGWRQVPAETDVHGTLSKMISMFIDGKVDEILRKKDAAAVGVLFYAATPFRVDGMGFTPARAGTFCPFELVGNELLARLAASITL